MSHCKTASKREQYVNLMQKHMEIDVFGKCNKNNVCEKKDQDCRQSIIRDYFFYLSFENTFCKDYVTEKVFSWFNEDIITVVRGEETNRNYLPKGTYIDTWDFKNPVQLSEFLNILSRDEKRYTAYLKRKDYFRAQKKGRTEQNAYCELCKRLNNLDKYRQSIQEIYAWWGKNACTRPSDLYLCFILFDIISHTFSSTGALGSPRLCVLTFHINTIYKNFKD